MALLWAQWDGALEITSPAPPDPAPQQGNTAEDKASPPWMEKSPVHLPVRASLVWNSENSIKTSPRTACARAGAPSHGIPSSSWDCGRATRASLDLSLPHHLFLKITIIPTALESIHLAEHSLGSSRHCGERWGQVETCPRDRIPAVDQQAEFSLCLIQKNHFWHKSKALGSRTNKARKLKTSKHYFPLKEHWKKSRLYLNKCYTTFFIIFTSQQTLKGESDFPHSSLQNERGIVTIQYTDKKVARSKA